METLKIPKSAFTNLLHDYAEAIFYKHKLGSSYWQGKEDALMVAIHYCWGLTSVDVEENKEFKQILIDIENSYHQNID